MSTALSTLSSSASRFTSSSPLSSGVFFRSREKRLWRKRTGRRCRKLDDDDDDGDNPKATTSFFMENNTNNDDVLSDDSSERAVLDVLEAREVLLEDEDRAARAGAEGAPARG